MQLKALGLGAAVPIAAATLMSVSAPAQAITFGGGDILNITGAYTTSLATPFKFTFSDVPGDNTPNAGNFGVVNDTTTGGFAAFITNGAVVPEYDIANLDFSSIALNTLVNIPFLALKGPVTGAPGTPAASTNDSFTFVITELLEKNFMNSPGPLAQTNLLFKGKFVNAQTQEAVADGVFTGNFADKNGKGSFSGTFVVAESVPEPGAIGGLLVIGSFGVGLMLKRQRQDSATLALLPSSNKANDLN